MARPSACDGADPVGEHGKGCAQIIGGARRQCFDEFELVAAYGQQEGLRRPAVALAGDGEDGLGTHDVAGELDGRRRRHDRAPHTATGPVLAASTNQTTSCAATSIASSMLSW